MKKNLIKSTILILLTVTLYSCNKEMKEVNRLTFKIEGENRTNKVTNKTYEILDISIDPVEVNGVSETQQAELISNGWVLTPLPSPALVDEQFLDPITNEFYYKTGIMPEETLIWIPEGDWSLVNSGDVIITHSCGNSMKYWILMGGY